ncbi:hypothetical protein ACHAWC_008368 [Mediolabrus comicus]
MVSSDGDKVSEEEKDRLLPAATGLGLPAVGDITIFTTDQQTFLSSNKTSKKRQKKQRSSHFSSSLPKLSSCSDPPPVVKRIQHRKHAPPQKDEESVEFPHDEDSTLIREGRKRIRVCCRNFFSRLSLLLRSVRSSMNASTNNNTTSPFRARMEYLKTKFRHIDLSKIILLGLFICAFLLMQFGTSSSASSVYYSEISTNNNMYATKNKKVTSTSKGYQARSQVPISIEYANFVDLSEFADAVSVLRLHRQQVMQQQHNDSHRRLDIDEKSKGENDDEVKQMNNAIDASWEKTIKDNPDMVQSTQQESVKVKHVPFLWHIPRTGGTSLTSIFANCLTLVQASSSLSSPPIFARGEDEALASRFRDPTLYVVRTKGQSFVNVDLDSVEGVQRAVQGGLISKELADVVVVPDVRLGSLLFGNGQDHIHNNNINNEEETAAGVEYKGVLFAMFRHPIERTLSFFYHKQQDKESVHYDPSMEIYSLVDWVNSPSYMTNFMTRTLVGKVDNAIPLTEADLDVAKEILRRKCVVGLLDEKTESMKRFAKLFGWDADVHHHSLSLLQGEAAASRAKAERWKNQIVNDEECQDRLLHYNWLNKHRHPALHEGSIGYKVVESKNKLDLELYYYTRQLFDEQYTQLGFDEDLDVSI